MKKTLRDDPVYMKFVRERNKALERIHANFQIDIARMTFALVDQFDKAASQLALNRTGSNVMALAQRFENETRTQITNAFPAFIDRFKSLRRAAFVLAYAGEQEAIGRATMRRAETDADAFRASLKEEISADCLYGPLHQTIWKALVKLRHRVIVAFELALSQELPADEVLAKVRAVFPKLKEYKRPPYALSKVKPQESAIDDEERESWFAFDFITDEDWAFAVDAYKQTELPPDRFCTSPGYDFKTSTFRMPWEIEQEGMDDFVRSVRSGQVEGAEELGVKEFVWISVIDSKTCEDCCLPRHGLTTSEIAQMGDDDCDAEVPPAHFNCRCDIGPVADSAEVEGPNWEDFTQWLEAA